LEDRILSAVTEVTAERSKASNVMNGLILAVVGLEGRELLDSRLQANVGSRIAIGVGVVCSRW
jgi:hypothetical protein